MPDQKFDIPENELVFSYIRADGPGGQNVNKVATAVQLRYDLQNSRVLPEDVKARLMRLAGKRMTEDGVLIIEARRYREQESQPPGRHRTSEPSHRESGSPLR